MRQDKAQNKLLRKLHTAISLGVSASQVKKAIEVHEKTKSVVRKRTMDDVK